MKINIGVSNRHVHLTEQDFKILFGEGAVLEKMRDLKQPGEFASSAVVTLKTNKDQIDKVRVLGPFRNYTQIEISKTDAYKLGLNPPVRESGDIKDSEEIILVGPIGTVLKQEGCIIANRHIHATPADVEKYKLDSSKKYCIRLKGEKGGVLNGVSIKVSPNYVWEMHIDTDDANAHLIDNENNMGEIIGEDHESI